MNALLVALALGAAQAQATPPATGAAAAPSAPEAPVATVSRPVNGVTPFAPSGPPLSLDEALKLARQNPQLAQAQAQLAQASGQVGISRSGFLPSGSASGKAGWTGTNEGAVPSGTLYATYNATVTLNQTLWDFGRTLGSYLAARDQERAARAGLDTSWNAVELGVRTAYYTVLATEALVAVADQTVASNQRQLDLAKGQYEVGQRPRFDVTTADVNLQQSIISQITAHDAVILARIALAQAVGQDVSKRPLELPAVPQDIELDSGKLMQEALRARPDLRSADLQISAADQSLSAARSAWYPILGVSASYIWNNSRFPVAGGLPAPDANSWNILGTISWPFLAGGADLGRVDVAKGALDSTKASRDQLLLQIRTDVEQAITTVNEARARRTVSRVLVAQAKENLDLAEGRYQAGLGTIIDVTTSQTSYTSAQAQEVKAAFDLASAWAQLEHAVGR
jgi:outer membrane protein TolC